MTLAFGFGNPVEIAIIAGVVVLLFGGAKLSEFGRHLGSGIKEFKKATQEDEETPPSPASTTAPPPAVGASKTEEK